MTEQSEPSTLDDDTHIGSGRNATASNSSPTVAHARRLLKRSRPRFWLYLAGPVLVGLTHGATSASQLTTPLALALVAYFLVPANVYLYGVNDVFDRDVDAENPKKDDREVRYDGDRVDLAAVALAGLSGFALLFAVPTPAVPWFAGFLLLGTAYSAPPFRLKTRAPLDSLSNGLYILPGVGAYVVLAGTTPPAAAIAAGWLWTMAMHTFSAIPDIEPDRDAGIETTATVLGERRTFAYCALVWGSAAAVAWTVAPAFALLLATYPAVLAVVSVAEVPVRRAYWWFPVINTLAGATLTIAGLSGLVYA